MPTSIARPLTSLELRRRRDEVSVVIGDHRYAQPYYFPALKARTIGERSGDQVGVSRYYFLVKPGIVVDFEPSPLDAKFWLEEKRQFFYEQVMLYVPVFLKERLTLEQFAARLDEAKADLKQPASRRALAAVEDDVRLLDSLEIVLASILSVDDLDRALLRPQLTEWIDHEADKQVRAAHPHANGFTRTTFLKTAKREICALLRREVRHGNVGSLLRQSDLAVALGRREQRQV